MTTALIFAGYIVMMIIVARVIIIPGGKRFFGSVDGEDAPFIVMFALFWPLVIFAAAVFGFGWGLWKLITVDIPNPVSAIKKHRRKPTAEELQAEIDRLERELEMGDHQR